MKTWQIQKNSEHFTNERLKCTACRKFVRSGIDIRFGGDIPFDNESSFVCWKCLQKYLETCWHEYDEEFVLMRSIIDVLFEKRNESKKQERSKMTLKLRFYVMKRDLFCCQLCGKTAKESPLEVDHIVPISKDGETTLKNLQTTCFECNRGKGTEI